jgi:hypothetical protein
VITYDISLESRRMVDLVDGVSARWRSDLGDVDQEADDAAFTVISSTP